MIATGAIVRASLIWSRVTLVAMMGLSLAACGTTVESKVIADTSPPTINSVTPASGATGVSGGAAVTVEFSEAMDRSTLTSASFSVAPTGGGAAVAGVVTANGSTASFTPAVSLQQGAQYTATVTAAVTDVAGNHLAAQRSWVFTIATVDTVAPVITTIAPGDGAVDVSPGTAVSIVFSEAVNSATLTPTSFRLETAAGSTVVSGSIVVSGSAAVFTPAASLSADTQYRATITTAVTDVAGNPMATARIWTFTTARVDTAAPTVTGTSPAAGATNVPLGASVTALFSESLNAGSVNSGSFLLTRSGSSVAISGQVSAAGAVATFTPSVALSSNTPYTATIFTSVQDLAGNQLASPYTWSFTTATVDTTPPVVTSTSPADGASGVLRNALITATFSELLDSGSVTASSFQVRSTSGGVAIQGSLSFNGSTVLFTPAATLGSDTQYTVTISTAVRDLAGNALASERTWTFRTVVTDTTPPAVASTTPATGATSVTLNSTVSATFSEAMSASTINGSSFQLKSTAGNVAVAGTVSLSGNTATFTPSAQLAAGTQYTATVSTAVADVAGNALASAYSWSFTTLTVDTTRPTVTSNFPASGAGQVALSSAVTATFSEAMNASTINTSTFQVRVTSSGSLVSGSVSLSGNTATFTPSAQLAVGTQYTATVSTAVADVAGNALASAYSWSFTTLTVDTTPPTVTSNFPANGAGQVALGATATATFSEAMNAGTITGSSFQVRVTSSGTLVSGSVSLSGNTATFTPSAQLAAGTQYTATVSTAVADVAGNALASAYSWSFTTLTVDTTPPTITSTSPASGANQVGVGTAIAATFSEAMNASTINTSTFQVRVTSSGSLVSGSVSLSGNTATFAPTASLLANTQYSATVTTGAQDAANNSLAASYNWNFTTGAVAAGPSLGAHAIVFKQDTTSTSSLSLPALTTQASGSTIVVSVGRGRVSDHVAPTDSKGNSYAQLGTSHVYTRFGNSGTALYSRAVAAGGSGHVISVSTASAPTDEVTMAAVEITGGGAIQDSKWNEVLVGGSITSLPVTTTGPATLVAFWWGDGDGGVPHNPTPQNGFTRIDAVIGAGSLVQCAVATLNVPSAGTYTVTWTSTPAEGAQLWLVAVQAP